MPHVRVVSDDEATGPLARLFRAALQRAGRVWHVVRLMSLNPEALETSMGLYRVLMFGRSPLSRAQREAIAVAVSRANDCYY